MSYHIILSCYNTIILSYHCHTIILSYYRTIILSYYHTMSYHTVILSYYHTIIPSYTIILSYYHTIILSYYHTIILSYYHTMIRSYEHTIILARVTLYLTYKLKLGDVFGAAQPTLQLRIHTEIKRITRRASDPDPLQEINLKTTYMTLMVPWPWSYNEKYRKPIPVLIYTATIVSGLRSPSQLRRYFNRNAPAVPL